MGHDPLRTNSGARSRRGAEAARSKFPLWLQKLTSHRQLTAGAARILGPMPGALTCAPTWRSAEREGRRFI